MRIIRRKPYHLELTFNHPRARIHVLSDCHLSADVITLISSNRFLDRWYMKTLALPTMYKGWRSRQKSLVSLKGSRGTPKQPSPMLGEKKNVLIFDTWGVSSYYHLLIDHIIPIWITSRYLEEIGIESSSITYYRVSRNNWDEELSAAKQIFKYFLNEEFVESFTGDVKKIVYGYLYSYRPFHGPDAPPKLFPEYKRYLEKFRSEFALPPDESEGYVLVPTRTTRTFEFVDNFVAMYGDKINFRLEDMGALTIESQIRVTKNAKAIFGSEGAAFANQVFIAKGSPIIAVATESSRFSFHSTLSEYLENTFLGVILDQKGEPSEELVEEIFNLLV